MSFIRTIVAIFKDFIRYFNLKTRQGRYRGLALAVVVAAALFFLFGNNEPEEAEEAARTPEVSVRAVRELAPTGSFSAVGTVTAVSEATLQAEAGGRVTTVRVEIGDTVGAGTILATLESQSEQASLLQAQGAYEAALAAAAVSDVSVKSTETRLEEAKSNAQTAFVNAYNTTNSVLITSINSIYTDPESTFPGVRIDGGSDTPYLNSTRIMLQQTMPAWLTETQSISTADNLEAKLTTALERVDAMSTLVDTVSSILNRDPVKYASTPYANLATSLVADRAALSAARSNLTNQLATLKQAEDALAQAELGGTNSTLSAANAQVKIALGSLRAAQASYEKTVVRTPISGVVNALYLKEGDFVAPSALAALVANNNGLEINTAITEEERDQIAIGDEVAINRTERGVVSAIGGAIDPSTGKIALKVSVADGAKLQNGSTASITFSKAVTENNEIVIPLSSIKMTGSGPVAFFVTSENTLEQKPVVLGAVSGDSVVVSEGLTLDDRIVVDARGLKAGHKVNVN